MKKILFTDTHFGVKNNSITWLNSQMDFIYKQLIPYIEQQKEPVLLIHLGDVFDSRSSISPFVASKVVGAFKALSFVADKFIVIGGNHDFYSPNSDQVDSLNLLLSKLDIDIVTTDIQEYDNSLFIPWYRWGEHVETNGIKHIFAHTDIVNETCPYNGVKVWSGHVHIPCIKNNLYNIGSCYSLNFADANQERGFYVVDDNDDVEFIPNKYSIRFWRLKDDEIFDFQSDNKNDYIELYVDKWNIVKDEYSKRVCELLDIYKNIWVIPIVEDIKIETKEYKGYDIEEIIKNSIPEHLQDKFNQLLNEMNDQSI